MLLQRGAGLHDREHMPAAHEHLCKLHVADGRNWHRRVAVR
jgi:hypothetical protein